MKDIKLDFENQTMCANGDIVTGESDEQHKRLLITCEKGSFKEFPATGVGAGSWLESEDAAGLLREVRTQFQADGMKVNKVVIENNKLLVDASY